MIGGGSVNYLRFLITGDSSSLQAEVEKSKRTVTGMIDGIGNSVGRLGPLIGGVFAGVTVTGFIGKLVSVQREFDVLNSSLVTVTGSSAAAGREMEWLKSFAKETPYGLSQATQAFVKMSALGLSPTRSALNSFGNTASAMGKDLMQMIEAVADASTGEFERLKEFGIKSSKEGENVKFTFQGVTTTVRNSSQEISDYLEAIGNNQFASAMAERAKTLDGQIAALGDSWDELFRTINQNNTGGFIYDTVTLASGALEDLNTIILAANSAMNEGAGKGSAYKTVQDGLAVAFETVAVLGTSVKFVLTAVGTELGGLTAQAAAIVKGDFAGAAEIHRQMVADAKTARVQVDAQTEAILNARKRAADSALIAPTPGSDLDALAKSFSGYKALTVTDGALRDMADGLLKTTTGLKSAAESMSEVRKKGDEIGAMLKRLREQGLGDSEQAKQLESRLGGVNEKLKSMAEKGSGAERAAKQLGSAYKSFTDSIEEKIAAQRLEISGGEKLGEADKLRIKYQQDLLGSLKGLSAAERASIEAKLKALKVAEKENEARKQSIRLLEEERKYRQDWWAAQGRLVEELESGNTGLRAEIELIGLSAVEQAKVLRLREEGILLSKEQQLAEMRRTEDAARFMSRERIALEQEIELRRERLALTDLKGARTASAQAVTASVEEWRRGVDQIGQSLADQLMQGGKGFGDYLKNLGRTLVFRPIIQAVVQGGAASGLDMLGLPGSKMMGFSKGGMSSGLLNNLGSLGAAAQAIWGLSAGASTASLAAANAVGLVGGDAIGALAAANGMWAGVATGAQAAAQAAVAANLALEAGTGVALEAGTLATATGTAEAAGGLSGALGSIPGWGWALAGGALLLSQLDFGSRGANHSGAAASSLGIGNTAAAQKLMGDSRGDWYTDLTDRYNADLDKQLSGTVSALAGVYEKLSGYAGDAARSIELVGGFAVNGKYGDEGAVGYGQIWDRVSGQYLGGFSNRDLGTDKDKAWTSFVGQMGGLIVAELKASDIPGWMRAQLEAIGDDVTVDGLNAALQAISVVDTAFKGWASTLMGFADLSAEVQTALLNVSGGIEGLGANVNTFYNGFYAESERMGILQRQVLEQLSGLGVIVDTSTAEAAKESFRVAVEGALAAGKGELAAQLLALSGSFATAADYASQSAEKIVAAAQESAAAATTLRGALIDLGQRLPGAGAEVQQLRVEGLASQVQGLFAGVGIEKDAGVLAQKILSATSGDVEEYFRSMWGMLSTDEARQKLVTVTGALLDLAGSAEAAAKAVAAERQGLEQQWLQAVGDTAALRQRELQALDPSNRALQEMIWGLEDAKTGMSELATNAADAAQKAAQAWQGWGTAAGLAATHLGDASGLEARRAVLNAQISSSTDPADRLSKLQELISVEQSIAQAQQEGRRLELDAIKTRQQALQKEIASAQQLLSAAQALGSYVQSLRTSEASGLPGAQRLTALGGEYSALLGKARGGDAEALARLQSVSSDYIGLSRELAASGSDYSTLVGRVSAELEAVSLAQQQVAQAGITAREAEIAQLTQQNEYLSAGVELSDETKRLIQKSMVEQQDAWGRESSRADALAELQQRATDSLAVMPDGIARALNPVVSGAASYIAGSVGNSVSGAIGALASMLGLESVPAFAAGGWHVGGMRLVGERGPELEVTGAARYWNASQTQAMLGGGGGDAARLEALVHVLIDDNRRLGGEMLRWMSRVARPLEQWQIEGVLLAREDGSKA